MLRKDMYIALEEFEPNISECYAHLPLDGGKKETVIEHTKLCQKYFLNIIQQKKLDKVFIRFREKYLGSMSSDTEILFDSILMNVVTFHDMGKINPLFQIKKMKHKWHPEIAPEGNLGSKHSILSAAFYLDYFLCRVGEVENKEEKRRLKDLVFIHSFLIARHHGVMKEFKEYVYSFDEDSESNLGWYAKKWLDSWKEKVEDGAGSIFTIKDREKKNSLQRIGAGDTKRQVWLYGYSRLLYSLLVASDYYATTEFMSGVEIKTFGNIENLQDIIEQYEKTEVMKSIRTYESSSYPMDSKELERQSKINILRTELFLDAERELKEHSSQSLFYLEAPTGSGKSNTSINLSFQLLSMGEGLQKIFYIYPFNTLVEQNMETLRKVFGDYEKTMAQIAVVNSLVPIKGSEELYDTESQKKFQELLLDRQFLNYPLVLSTHVSLFRTLFGNGREDLFGFHQLCNSVIVLDEIQSYKNELWSEIITFLKGFAQLLNIKVIIMSATLPNLEILTDNRLGAVNLINDREKYFNHPVFAKRVVPNYELLQEKITLELLAEHMIEHVQEGKKILIEFINKSRADGFYRLIKEKTDFEVLLMTGDSSILDRKRMIHMTEELETIILVATQVVEAGVDIDFDIGYKDSSRLDSEEQFMGRINRSCKRSGVVYFFDLDDAKGIYRRDIRINPEFTLKNETMREILATKNYQNYYEQILRILKMRKEKADSQNLEQFFSECVGSLDFVKVHERMKLIDDNRQMVSVYLARNIKEEGAGEIDGRTVWEEYKELLLNEEMEFAEKKVRLYKVRSSMNVFLYQLSKNAVFDWNEQIGDIYYIEDGEAFFDENGILDRKKFENGEMLFL
ncbi:CRISPR-associated helicase Cas3' [Ruminococcus sp. OA3]|uniref:CRISPR-associated helicase Cas3' n=1 Tax=Ruminococcus sp. OA3 TaxID=2914164 RepID=UPI001F0565F7|nr:CRISPR-associated helicase Cas3' [Ruminococcus sp. OA3]MCH1981236.1 CRISPR-associated helicase Cas3' [Ruminococcus sp. OA3]